MGGVGEKNFLEIAELVCLTKKQKIPKKRTIIKVGFREGGQM